jgi:hypothetical protein
MRLISIISPLQMTGRRREHKVFGYVACCICNSTTVAETEDRLRSSADSTIQALVARTNGIHCHRSGMLSWPSILKMIIVSLLFNSNGYQ